MALPYKPGRQSYSEPPDASVGLFRNLATLNDRQQENALFLLPVVKWLQGLGIVQFMLPAPPSASNTAMNLSTVADGTGVPRTVIVYFILPTP